MWKWFRTWLADPDSQAEREYEAELRRRPQLDDDAFYEQYYAGSGVPRSIPIRCRRLLVSIVGIDLAAIQPRDNIAAIFEGLDFADVLYRINREFGVSIPLEAATFEQHEPGKEPPAIDGTFDSVVRSLASTLAERSLRGSSRPERDEHPAGP